jgi:hypothetical protein
MRNFLNNLFRDFRTSSSARGGRRMPRRTRLEIEGLEERLALSTATQTGSILSIIVDPGELMTLRSDGAGHIEVLDNTIDKKFTISSINSVSIGVQTGNAADNVQIDDSNGMPFFPGTTITLYGYGGGTGGNVLGLVGSRTVAGGETYVAGGASFTLGTISMDNLKFQFDRSIGGVYDSIPITGTLDIQTSGTNVQLNSYANYGPSQQLSGMGSGGGGSLVYSNKGYVQLEDYAVNANITLKASSAAPGEQYFEVNMHGAGDTTTIAATPSNVITDVVTYIAPVANQATVNLEANAGPVDIGGNSTTSVTIGQLLGNGLSTTRGIQANVTVAGAESLVVIDTGSLVLGTVTLTPSTITGPGLFFGLDSLFGNSGVSVSYSNVGRTLVTWDSPAGIEVLSENWIHPFNGVSHPSADGLLSAPSTPNAVVDSVFTSGLSGLIV